MQNRMRERQDVVLKGTTKKHNMTGHELILEPHRKIPKTANAIYHCQPNKYLVVLQLAVVYLCLLDFQRHSLVNNALF